MAKKEVNKGGYTTVTLGKELLDKVDKHASKSVINNRSMTIRMILQQYYELKDNGVDILKMDAEDFNR